MVSDYTYILSILEILIFRQTCPRPSRFVILSFVSPLPHVLTNHIIWDKHIWITMVLMSSFFACIKMTLLFFYKRLFLVSNSSPLSIFWWTNFVYVVLWFFGSTSFYLFQCKPVQWYFIQYFHRYPHLPVPGGMTGQCDATSVLHVALPLVFSLISDFSLLLLPIWAISKLRLNKSKKRGLMAVFGIGLVACFLELARVLVLVIHTDDKDDPSCKLILRRFQIFVRRVSSTYLHTDTGRWCRCIPHFDRSRRDYSDSVRMPSRDCAPDSQAVHEKGQPQLRPRHERGTGLLWEEELPRLQARRQLEPHVDRTNKHQCLQDRWHPR